jgi:hypothetical protein
MRGRIVEMMFISAFLVACGTTPTASVATPSVPTVTQNTDTTAPQVATVTPEVTEGATVVTDGATPTQFVLPTSTPSNADAPDATALAATTIAQMPATATPDASGLTASLQGDVVVVALSNGAKGQFFATISKGMMENIDDPHPLTIYQKNGSEFVKVTQYDFTNGEYIGDLELLPNPDPNHALFIVHGGVGAHSSFGNVFSFDGKTLKLVLETQSDAGGGALTIQDINGDGVLDAIGDATDYYVFCYACGVRIYSDTIYSWDGTKFVEQTLTKSSDATIQQAIDYAKAQRWNMVTKSLPTISAPTNDADKWNVALLTHWSTIRKPQTDDAFPFLSAVYYGDYDAAVALLRAVGAKDAANPKGKWFAGPIAEGIDVATDTSIDEFRVTLFDNVVQFSTMALTQDDTVTSARFLRGWAKTLVNPRDPEGLKDLQAVATADPFYAAVRDAIISR